MQASSSKEVLEEVKGILKTIPQSELKMPLIIGHIDVIGL
jgi:hypothetical protein